MKKAFKTVKILLCVLLCLVLSSCSMSAKKINDLTIVQALSVDEDEGKTKIALQYLNLAGSGGSAQELQSNITQIKSAKGENISLAIFSASKSASNDIFFGQNKLIVFGFDYAKNDISKGLDFLLKSPYSRPDVLVALSKTKGEDIINSKEKDSKIPAQSVYKLLELGEENGTAAAPTVCDLMNLYNDETSDIYLPILETKDDKTNCVGIALFSENKYVSSLTEEEVLAFLMIKNKLENSLISTQTENLGRVSLNIISSNAKNSVEIKNGTIHFNIDISLKVSVAQTDRDIKFPLSEKDYKAIQNACNRKTKALCKHTVKKCFDSGSDVFMCARYLCLKNDLIYNAIKDELRKNLGDIKVKISVESELQRIGNNTV